MSNHLRVARFVFSSFVVSSIVLSGCAAVDDDEPSAETESLLSAWDSRRGNRIADRAMALWNGRPSRNLCLAGVGDTLESSGVVSPAFPRLPSAVDFDDWARSHPSELARRGFEKQQLGISSIPRGSIITWRPGQCGYHSLYGHVEIVVDSGSSRACSDYCGAIKKNCGAPGIYVPVTGGATGPACAVQNDGKLHCDNTDGAAIRRDPKNNGAIVNHLRTTNSWFDCWTTGDRHAGGNTTWYHTLGDDNGEWGFVAGIDLETPDAFDADPTARGLRKCQ